jgi:hypothetical protein
MSRNRAYDRGDGHAVPRRERWRAMNRLRYPGLRVSRLMEGVAALAVLLAFWTWRLRSYHTTIVFECFTFLVTALYVIAVIVSGATESRHRRLHRWSRLLGVLNILIAFWFVSVEWYWFFEDCPNCHRSRIVGEYRFVSLFLHREELREYPTLIEWIAADLGTPCSHTNASRWQKQRWSGLCLIVEDGGCGHLFYDPPWYPPCARNAVLSWLARDPGFAQTFRKRVLEQWDRPYWYSLFHKMYGACPQDRLPSYVRRRDEAPPDEAKCLGTGP